MEWNRFMWVIVGAAVLLIIAFLKKTEWIINIVMRSILGAISIYFINMGLAYFGIESGVGMNTLSVLTSGILGFPGLLALYGLGFYNAL